MVEEIKKGYKRTEVGIIPNDWESLPLNNVSFSIASGKSKTQSRIEGKFPIYGSTGIIGMSLKSDYENEKILVARVGANAGMVNSVDGKYCVSDNTLMIQLNKETDFSFVLYFLKYSNLNKLIFGSGQPLITGTQLKNLQIPLPPTKEEQTAIATTLSDTDVLLTQLEKLIEKKRAIKQGAMQELLTPKEGWEEKKLGSVFKFLRTANNSRSDLQEDGEIEYIHYGDIHTKWNSFLDCSKNSLPYISYNKIKGLPFLQEGDLIVADASEDYEGLGACVEIKNIKNKKIVSGLHTLLLRGDKDIIADGFKGYFKNYYRVQTSLIASSTGVSVYGISKSKLKNIEINIPSLSEQSRIAQILSDMDSEIEALEKKLEKYKMIKQGMMQNLLTGKIRLTILYHASLKIYKPGDKIIADTTTPYYEKMKTLGREWVDDFLDEHKPSNAPERKYALFACDSVENCYNFIKNVKEKKYYYKVEMKEPVKAVMCLTDWILTAKQGHPLLDAMAKEYWSPTNNWKFYEYLSSEMTIIELVEEPDLIGKNVGYNNYWCDTELRSRLYPI